MTFEVPALAAGFASKFDTIGPYVGFGSLIAVVAMAVLVFSQGRELQRLREWAGTAPERLDELEQRFEEDLQRPRGQTLAPHPGAQQQQRVPGQPPVPGRPGVPGVAGVPQRPPAVGASMAGGVATAATAAGAAGAAAGGATPKPTPKPTPPGGGGPQGDGPGAGPPTRVLSASAPGGPRAASAAGIAAKTAREREAAAADAPRRTPAQIIGVAVVLIVVLVGVLFALGIIGGGSDSPTAERNAADQKRQKVESKKKAKPYSAPATSVVVLNGSGTNGLAKGASGILDEKRFNTGPSNDFTVNGQRSQQALSTVAYRAGRGNKDAALDIAKALKLPASRVKPMTSDVRMAVSGSPKIIVILGLDYAAKQNGGVAPADTATTPPADQQSTDGTGATGTGSGTTTGTTDGTGSGAAGTVDPATGGATGDTTGGAATDGSGGVTTP